MKRIFFVALLLPVLYFSTGCKKSNEADIPSLFKNTVWTGRFTYLGMTEEPYSLQFKEDGTFTWIRYQASSTGNWTLSGSQLSLVFSATVTIKADVSNDKTLTNIQNNPAGGWLFSSGQYNTATEQAIDNTTWKENNNAGALTFSTSSKVSGTGIFGSLQNNDSYFRIGAVLTFPSGFNVTYFSVLQPDGKTMVLINKTFPNYHPYVLTRQ